VLDGRQDDVDRTRIRRASGPQLPPLSAAELRRRRRHAGVVCLSVLVIFSAAAWYLNPSGSGRDGPAARAATACVDAATAAHDYSVGTRSASSTRSALRDAEVTLQGVVHQYAGYASIARSVRAVADDVAAGALEPSPNDVHYLGEICGSPSDTSSSG
jgi:hypothetical protein